MSYYKRKISEKIKSLRAVRVPEDVTSSAISLFLQSLDCPRSLTVDILFRNGEYRQIVELECDQANYENVASFREAYAATCFLSKYSGFSTGIDVRQVAILKFKQFEESCKLVNKRFKDLSLDPEFSGLNVRLHDAVVRKIERILGSFDPEEIVELANWGPGATTLIKSRDASSFNKFQHEVGITRDLFDLIPTELMKVCYPSWAQHLLEVGFPNFQVGNKVVTVPKNAKTDRVIAIEPGINLWFQKAIGSMLEKRLNRFGVELRNQTKNQLLAREGSKNLLLATVDFSSASDSISSEVVRSLLPPRWFTLLDSARSRYGTLDGTLLKWEKFSSMGNGFTFQLESLIFFAIAKCCVEYLQVEGSVSVYGDDVIIPCKAFNLFSKLSAFYGFSVNSTKSFCSSVFTESCGKHWYEGADVTPVYLKDRLSDIRSVFRLANAIRRFSHRRLCYLACDRAFKVVFDYLVNQVPKKLILWIPETLGDGGFIENFDIATPSRARHGFEGFRVQNLVETSIMFVSEEVGILFARLWIASVKMQRNTVAFRDRTKLELKTSLVHQWYDLGPWI